jgi:hypothetical protein
MHKKMSRLLQSGIYNHKPSLNDARERIFSPGKIQNLAYNDSKLDLTVEVAPTGSGRRIVAEAINLVNIGEKRFGILDLDEIRSSRS